MWLYYSVMELLLTLCLCSFKLLKSWSNSTLKENVWEYYNKLTYTVYQDLPMNTLPCLLYHSLCHSLFLYHSLSFSIILLPPLLPFFLLLLPHSFPFPPPLPLPLTSSLSLFLCLNCLRVYCRHHVLSVNTSVYIPSEPCLSLNDLNTCDKVKIWHCSINFYCQNYTVILTEKRDEFGKTDLFV